MVTGRRLPRRRLLAAAGLLPLSTLIGRQAITAPAVHAQDSPGTITPQYHSRLAQRLARDARSVQRGPDGRVAALYGIPFEEARWLLYAVTRIRPLPGGFQPKDLSYELGQPLRVLATREAKAMTQSAAAEGIDVSVVSGFRTPEHQALIFENSTQLQLARDAEIDRAEAERRAARFVARPGHSQHQLGTAADLSSWEINYGVRGSFGDTAAGQWTAERAWEFGFVLPYTEAGQARTGYIAEPWHVRWVGRQLAAVLWEMDYLHRAEPTVDDVLLAIEDLQEL